MAAKTPTPVSGRLLPPDVTQLLPPAGAAPPPAAAPTGVAGAGSIGTPGAHEGLDKARDMAELVRRRALKAVTDHGPTVKRHARSAADIAGAAAREGARQAAIGATAATLAAQEAWKDSKGNPARRRAMILGGAGGILAVMALIWVIAQQHATAIARIRVAGLLDQYGLRGTVLYRDVSASPFGTVTLSNVTLQIDGGVMPIRVLRVSGIAADPDSPIRASVAVEGAVVPVIPVAQSGALGSWPAALLGLGVVHAVVDGSVSFQVDDRAEILESQFAIHAAGVGGASGAIRLGGVNSGQLNQALQLARSLQSGRAMAFDEDALRREQLLQSLLAGVSWQGGNLRLDDSALRPRARQVNRRSMPSESDDANTIGPVARLPLDAFESVIPEGDPGRARLIVQHWLDEGGTLVVRSDPPTPVGLFRRDEMNGVLPVFQDRAALVAAAISIDD